MPNQSSKKKKEFLKSDNSLRKLQYNIKCNNICIIGVPERERRKQRIENLFKEIMTENFPKMVKEKDIESRKHRESQTR